MKKKMISIVFTAGLILSLAFTPQVSTECNVEEALKTCKKKLLPYAFQDRKTITFSYGTESQMKEYKIQLFKGERYRFVFNSTYSPGVAFEVYDAPKDKSMRKLLFDSRQHQENVLIYQPEALSYVYVDLIIPKGNNRQKEGCATLMIGYELTFDD